MIGLVTSCNRPDLLLRTINLFYADQQADVELTIHEDTTGIPLINGVAMMTAYPKTTLRITGGVGQHKSIESFLMRNHAKYYVHIEDDWDFYNSYDWIKESVEIMERDPAIIKVLARIDDPHPCTHDQPLNGKLNQYGYRKPWRGEDGVVWHGFGWNPGVTRLDLLKQFIPFPKWEQELAQSIYESGFQVVDLANKIYSHIGDGRNTTQYDPAKKA